MRTPAAGALTLFAAVLSVVGCQAESPPAGPLATCAAACTTRAARCSREECGRGCEFALDRLLEREGDRVIECVAKGSGCGDATWSECASKVGIHADGGPPGPPPPLDD